MKNLTIILTLVFLAVSPAGATIISADADGYGDGTDISTVFAGITLSSVGGYSGLDGVVYAWGDGLASTGISVFANNLSYQRQWYADFTDGFALRADFNEPAKSVAIDIIADDPADIGMLYAYSAADTLLESVSSGELQYGEVFTAAINRTSFDIKYIIAGGAVDNTVHLDNLVANVPEPTSLLLMGLGTLALMRNRRLNMKEFGL